MYIHKIVFILFISCLIYSKLLAKQEISISFENLTVTSFIQIASKVLKKSILLPHKIKGEVDFISHKKIYKEDLLQVLKFVLESKGYFLLEEKNVLRIIKFDNLKYKSKNIVKVIYLKNAEAINIFKLISEMINQKKVIKDFPRVSISMDEESNSIVLMGNKEKIEDLTSLIDKLDVNKEQIFVQAKIIEISENLTKDVGIKYGLQGFHSSGSVLSTFSSSLNDGSIFDIGLLSNYGFDISSMKEALSLGMSLNLLQQNGAVDIISEPSLLCINNKESSIYVGETISIKTGTTTTSSGIPTDTYNREDIGLTLKVKPRISNNKKVLLKIHAKLENVDQISALSTNPNTSKKELITSAVVNNGETIILGGYIRAQKEIIKNKVAFLGDIPVLGELFKHKKEFNDKINLVIIITPYIIPQTKGVSYIRNKLSQLKSLEERYTKDAILKLSQSKFKNKSLSNQQSHDKRVKEILGL